MGLISKLFSSKKYPDFEFGELEVDMHSHLIPGIDDGAQSLEDALEMIRAFKKLGYRKIITTPHIKSGSFDNTTQIIRAGEKQIREAIQAKSLEIEFEAAAEYYFDYSFLERIDQDDILSFSDGHVLVEYSFHQPPMGSKEMIYALQMKRYKPILAHFERYPYYHGSVSEAEKLRDRGVKIQVNILSLFGHYGPDIKKQAALLIKNKQVDLLSSDCHRIQHLELFQQNLNNPLLHQAFELGLLNKRL